MSETHAPFPTQVATEAPTGPTGEASGMAAYRGLRGRLERAVLPLATSVDGRAFELQASLYDLPLRRGGYVVMGAGGRRRLGQVTELHAESVMAPTESLTDAPSSVLIRLARGTGVVLSSDGSPFHDAAVRAATGEDVAAWLGQSGTTRRAALEIGEYALAPGVPVRLDAGGFNRHTFMCGQSGSGKTYSLGVVLERLLAQTSLPVVILDPNSDYVGLGHLRDGAEDPLRGRYADAATGVRVWGDGARSDRRLRLRFADLDPAVQAAALGLDPIRDRDEYAVLIDLLRSRKDGAPLISGVDALQQQPTPAARQLAVRADNLGILGWRLWDPQAPSLVDEVRNPTARCTVVDLGSLDAVEERQVVTESVLSALWAARGARRPCLVVIDEAHNVCPAQPRDEVTRLCAERVVQIAAEGRKYGLYLLVATQRPNKLDENVVSQCDNLLLMRMSSQADLSDLARILSFVPAGLMAGATSFAMGHALVAGRILPDAAYVRLGRRMSEEGGADVPASWALPDGEKVPE
jgi:uncharacterized protein